MGISQTLLLVLQRSKKQAPPGKLGRACPHHFKSTVGILRKLDSAARLFGALRSDPPRCVRNVSQKRSQQGRSCPALDLLRDAALGVDELVI